MGSPTPIDNLVPIGPAFPVDKLGATCVLKVPVAEGVLDGLASEVIVAGVEEVPTQI